MRLTTNNLSDVLECSLFATMSVKEALNLQGMKFARKGSGNCKKRKTQGKAPKFASLWICKERNLQGNQQLKFARNGINKKQGGVKFAKNGLCKECV